MACCPEVGEPVPGISWEQTRPVGRPGRDSNGLVDLADGLPSRAPVERRPRVEPGLTLGVVGGGDEGRQAWLVVPAIEEHAASTASMPASMAAGRGADLPAGGVMRAGARAGRTVPAGR